MLQLHNGEIWADLRDLKYDCGVPLSKLKEKPFSYYLGMISNRDFYPIKYVRSSNEIGGFYWTTKCCFQDVVKCYSTHVNKNRSFNAYVIEGKVYLFMEGGCHAYKVYSSQEEYYKALTLESNHSI